MVKKVLPRGLRNNNPLNIRIGNDWQGEVMLNTDGVFEQFTSMEYGYRAAFIILRKYIEKYHRKTVSAIISAWAPSFENNTLAYVQRVCKLTGFDPDFPLRFEDKHRLCMLVWAMACVENGCDVDYSDVVKGYEIV